MQRFLRTLTLLLGILSIAIPMYSQVGIGTTTPHPRALLDLKNNGNFRGLQLPQVTTAGRAEMAAEMSHEEMGMVVLDTTATGGLFMWAGFDWIPITLGTQFWSRLGSRTYNTFLDDNVGIGTTNPQHKLSVGQPTTDLQPITIRGYSDIGDWKGGAAFGYDQATVIMGELNNVATIGGHDNVLGNWSALSLNPGGGNVGIGTATPSAKLHVEGSLRLVNGSQADGRVLTSDADGNATWQVLPASGITSLNGMTGGTQTFAIGTAGNTPVFNSAGGVHTLDIPMAGTGGVTAGLLSNGDYQFFQSKPDGSGTANYLTRWISPVALGVGVVMDDGTNVGIGLPPSTQHKLSVGQASTDAQPITIRGYSNIGDWKGGAAFGYEQATVIMGELNNVAAIGGHDHELGAWSALTLNPDGGNVGIGTYTPTAKLHVAGSFRLVNGSQAAGRVLTSDADGNTTWQDIPSPPAGVWTETGSNVHLVTGTHNVGIGTASPLGKLHVVTPNGQFYAGANDYELLVFDGNGWRSGIEFRSNGTARWQLGQDLFAGGIEEFSIVQTGSSSKRLVINAAGNVGIGTVTPTTSLHVDGNFRLVNGTQADGRILQSDAEGVATWVDAASAETDPKVGTLSTNTVPAWGGTELQDSPLQISGDNVGVGKAPTALFDVGSSTGFTIDIDQSNSTSGTAGVRAQSFRPNVSGMLAGFDLRLTGNPGDVLSIRLHSGEHPDTPNPISDLVEFTYPESGTQWYQLLFPTPVSVVAGQDYHLVLTSVSGSANYSYSTADPLPNGRMFFYSVFWNPGTSTDDLTFRTLMVESSSYFAVDGTTGQVGIGTTSPTATLHVDGSFRLENGSQANGHVLTSDANGVASWQAPAAAPVTGWTKTGSNVTLSTAGDNVGIGVATPTTRLEVAAGIGNLRVGARTTWAGGSSPTLYSSIGTEYLMIHSPHVPYLVNGQDGYTGTTVGARVRFGGDATTSSYWDVGTPSYAGGDRFTISRNEAIQMVVTNNTRVGIGTATPEASLDIVAGNIQLGDAGRLGFQITEEFPFDSKNMGHYGIGWYGDSWEPGGHSLWMAGFGGVRMFTNGLPRLSISRAGTVGIATNNPQHLFTIGNSADASNVHMRVYADNGYSWKGSAAFGFSTSTVIMGQLNGAATIGGHNSNLTAWANLLINPGGGNVGIGTTNPDYPLTVGGQIRASCGVLVCSDRNYKQNILPINHALSGLLNLEGVTYNWRTAEFTDMGFTEEEQLGVIAQNVEQYFPQAVHTGTSGFKTVDYSKLVPVLIEALKEEHSQRTDNEQQLMRMVQDLADQNRDLQAQLLELQEKNTTKAEVIYK